jgi:hypothetical protein
MDFTKYVSMLDSGGLFFARADLLGDPFEGSSSRANIVLRPEVYKETSEKMSSANEGAGTGWLEQLSRIQQWTRQWVYINCWHMNEYESAAMWRLYARTNEAIAVQSTYARLCEGMPSELYLGGDSPSEVFVGEVEYIDYETDWLPEGNSFYPFVHKRKSFEHERELQAVILEFPGAGMAVDNTKTGVWVKASLDDLIETVYVAPTAPDWFRNLVEAVTHKYDLLEKPIIRSSLDIDPVF